MGNLPAPVKHSPVLLGSCLGKEKQSEECLPYGLLSRVTSARAQRSLFPHHLVRSGHTEGLRREQAGTGRHGTDSEAHEERLLFHPKVHTYAPSQVPVVCPFLGQAPNSLRPASRIASQSLVLALGRWASWEARLSLPRGSSPVVLTLMEDHGGV